VITPPALRYRAIAFDRTVAKARLEARISEEKCRAVTRANALQTQCLSFVFD
jgi:hypothetical protein